MPRRHPSARTVHLAGGAVLIGGDQRAVHRLDEIGSMVWALCDGELTVKQIAEYLADRYAHNVDEVNAAVNRLLDGFDRAAMLVGTSQVATNTPPVAPPQQGKPQHPYGRVSLGTYRVGTLICDVSTSGDTAIDAVLQASLASLDVGPNHDDEPYTVDIWHDHAGWHVVSPSGPSEPIDGDTVVDFVVTHLNWLGAHHHPDFLTLHASVVAAQGNAALLVGVSNSGKSTLAAALTEAGCDYLSDELAIIAPATGHIVGYPKPIGLDEGSHHLWGHVRQPEHKAGRRWHMNPNMLRANAAVTEAELSCIVLPTYTPGASNTLVPLQPIDAMVETLRHAFNLADNAERLESLARLFERTPAYTLEHNGIAGPVSAIRGLL